MGGAASKEVAKKAAAKATTTSTAAAAPRATGATAGATTTQQPSARRVMRTDLSREAIVVSHLDTSTRDLNGASLMRNPNTLQKPVELQEMNLALLDDIKRFEDYEKVDFLEQNDAAFRDTASSYRARSNAPVTMPQDRTSASSTGFGGEVVEKIPGRLTNRELRELLRLRYENPATWTSAKLAEQYAMSTEVVDSIIANVGPPDVLEPRAASEFPYGVWFDQRRIDA